MRQTLLLCTLISGALGALSLQLYVRRFEREATGGEKQPVVVLLADVSAGDELVREQLGSRDVPQAYRDSRHIDARELDSLVGTRIAVAGRANEPLLWTDLTSARRGSRTLSDLVAPGMRAMTLVQRGAGLDALLSPGDRVDVLRARPSEPGLATVAESVLVLALGDRIDAAGKAPNRAHGLVTLSVTLEQAATIAAAEGAGPLRLVLRRPDDLGAAISAPDVHAQLGVEP